MTHSIDKPQQAYCVWFICADAMALGNIPAGHQHWQDMIVVNATCEEHALRLASSLLEARAGMDTTITRVMSESSLLESLETLRRVQRGDLRPASLRDRDLETWWLRFLK